MRIASLLAATVLAAATTLAAAHADPVIQYQVFDGSTLIGSGTGANGNIIGGSGSDANFSISLNASGSPFLTTPNFSNNSYTVSSSGGTGTITIKVTDTNLTGYSGGTILNTFSLNSLNGGGFSSATIANYFDNANTAFGTGTLIGSASFTGNSSFADQGNTASVTPSALFSETTIYTLTYGAGGNGTVSASAQLQAVPEPASLALFGSSLLAMGLIRRRTKTQA